MTFLNPRQSHIADQALAAMEAGDTAALADLRASMSADERDAMAQAILGELADRVADEIAWEDELDANDAGNDDAEGDG